MRTIAFALAGTVAWAVLAFKLVRLRKDPRNPFLRSFCVTIALVAIAFTVGLPPILSRLEQVTGVLAIWDIGTVIVGCASVQATLLLWANPVEQAWRKIRPRLVIYGLAVVVMLTLDLIGRIDARMINVSRYAETPELLYGRLPYLAESMLVYVTAFAYTSLDATGHFWRYAKVVDRRWLQRGLRIVAAGNMLIFGNCVAAAVFFVALRFGMDIAAAQRAEVLLASVGILVTAVGTTMPAWGPRIDRIVAYHQLHPLWLAVYRAAPEVVLDPPKSVRADRWKPWDVNFRLYRRIIEIRDGSLALRPYISHDIDVQARRLAQGIGLEGVDLQATVEAATLAAAINAKANGRPTAGQGVPADDNTGGDDVATELAWLIRVATAFARSPVVATITSVRDGASFALSPVKVTNS